ncbi:MAG: AAA family ATPase, partial [Deinococcus sp.]|nr:AAA family ATPase [Deinococcus sp.]
TRYGPVRTDHVLFIAAGAFHQCSPSDLIPELQGRFPIRVELGALGAEDLERILTQPEHSLTKQYQALLAVDGIELSFTPDGVRELAAMAQRLNTEQEDIGARRLHTILEKVLEEPAFAQGPATVVIDRAYVRSRLVPILEDTDLSHYIL